MSRSIMSAVLSRRAPKSWTLRWPAHRLLALSSCSRYCSARRPPVLSVNDSDVYPYGVPSDEPERALLRSFSWTIADGDDGSQADCWAVVGSVASGRADLVRTVLGQWRFSPPDSVQHPFLKSLGGVESVQVDDVIKTVSFKTRLESSAAGAGAGDFQDYTARYYAIRDDDKVTLEEHLRSALGEATDDIFRDVARLMRLDDLLALPLVTLSNGQTRRARIAKALMSGRGGRRPELLILEEPYTGLDVPSRAYLTEVLAELHRLRSPRILLVLRPQDPLPPFVTHVLALSSAIRKGAGRILAQGQRKDVEHLIPAPQPAGEGRTPPARTAKVDAKEIIRLNNVNVWYGGDRHVLKDINWTVRAGDRWSLSGANGSGKSTLLSLVLGDHPRSFSEDVELFGKPRYRQATAQLHSQIGHVSPEIFNAFPRRLGPSALTVTDSIVTGFHSIYSYRPIEPDQRAALDSLLHDFDHPSVLTPDFLSRPFAELSPGEQSLVLLLRALVNRPALVVLDEPFAGMDQETLQKARTFLDHELGDDQALIVISHYEEELPATIDRRIRMEDGRATVQERDA